MSQSTKVHPQDLIVEEILHKICSKKYGENWVHSAKNNKEQESSFDTNRKQYFSPRPTHNIKFLDYKKEFTGCIQKGFNPVFPYPALSFVE